MSHFKKHIKLANYSFFSLVFISFIFSQSASALGGYTLSQTGAPSLQWTGVASSSNGEYLAATVSGGDIYTSADYGVTWTDQTSSGSQNWSSITSSSDGSHLAATVSGGDIYTSADYGVTWTDQTSSGSQYWSSITSSSDGSHLAATISYNNDIYTSNNSGTTWTNQTSSGSQDWSSITSSSDGSRLAAVSYGDIYTSTDSGTTWTDQVGAGSSAGLNKWTGIAMSSDGSRLAAVSKRNDNYLVITTTGLIFIQIPGYIYTAFNPSLVITTNNNTSISNNTVVSNPKAPDTSFGGHAALNPILKFIIESSAVLSLITLVVCFRKLSNKRTQ